MKSTKAILLAGLCVSSEGLAAVSRINLACSSSASNQITHRTTYHNGNLNQTSTYNNFKSESYTENNEGKARVTDLAHGITMDLTPTTVGSDDKTSFIDPCTGKVFKLPKGITCQYMRSDRRIIETLNSDEVLQKGAITINPLPLTRLFRNNCDKEIIVKKPISFVLKTDVPVDKLLLTAKGRLVDVRTGTVLMRLASHEYTLTERIVEGIQVARGPSVGANRH